MYPSVASGLNEYHNVFHEKYENNHFDPFWGIPDYTGIPHFQTQINNTAIDSDKLTNLNHVDIHIISRS